MAKKKKEYIPADASSVATAVVEKPSARVIKMNVYDFVNTFVGKNQNVEAAGAFIARCERENTTTATKEEFAEKFQAFLASPPR